MFQRLSSLLSSLFVFSLFFCFSLGYKPVYIVHGVLSGNESMVHMAERIAEKHPGTLVYATDQFAGWSSLRPMWHQVDVIGKEMKEIMDRHPEGIHLIGYSQGGLVSRGLLEDNPDHNVKTFISLSAPQAGQYGTQFLHLFFPSLACEEAYELFYSIVGQKTSVGNYWNDPHHQALFLSYSTYLPFLNNIVPSPTSKNFTDGMLKLSKLVLIGGPDDEVITPWQSSQFGFFDVNETVVLMEDQGFYKNDSFGLRTLDKSGRLIKYTLPGNNHLLWHLNDTVIDDYILPHLD